MLFHLKWINPDNGEKFEIGKLYTEDSNYCFELDSTDFVRAKENGYINTTEFTRIGFKYSSPKLFNTFARRIPSPLRADIDEILAQYGMTDFDEKEYMRRSGLRKHKDPLILEEE